MNNLRFTIKVMAITIFMFAFASLAQAQATRTWASGVGDDANPCSRTAPCKTFAGTISKTAVNGEINCLDSGGFGSVTITKSITIKCEGVIGGITAAGVNGININDSATGTPGTAIVTLSGLDLDGAGTGINGINFIRGAALHVHKTQIRGFRGATGGNGILIAPSAGLAKIFVADSYITDNGVSSNDAGILIRPTNGASANVSVNRVQLENNINGIFSDGSGVGGSSNLTVKDTVVGGGSNNGIAIDGTGSALGANFRGLVDTTMINFNFNTGAVVTGANGTLRIGSCTISNNVTGVATNGGGLLQSFKNNQISGNGVDGTPLAAFPGPGGTAIQ
jgi:hypothetical protein